MMLSMAISAEDYVELISLINEIGIPESAFASDHYAIMPEDVYNFLQQEICNPDIPMARVRKIRRAIELITRAYTTFIKEEAVNEGIDINFDDENSAEINAFLGSFKVL